MQCLFAARESALELKVLRLGKNFAKAGPGGHPPGDEITTIDKAGREEGLTSHFKIPAFFDDVVIVLK